MITKNKKRFIPSYARTWDEYDKNDLNKMFPILKRKGFIYWGLKVAWGITGFGVIVFVGIVFMLF